MLCKKCSNELEDNATFCGVCGAPVDEAVEEKAETTPEANEAPAAETTEAPTVAESEEAPTSVEADGFATFDEQPAEKKKMSPKKVGICAVALALVAAILLVSFNFTAIAGFFIKTFGSDAAYFKFVEKVAFDEYSEGAFNSYDQILDIVKFDYSNKVELDVDISNDVIKMLESSLKNSTGENIDLDFINDTVFETELNLNKTLAQFAGAININKKDVIELDTIFDLKKGDAYLGFTNLTKEYISDEIEGIDEGFDLLQNKKFQKAIPTKNEVKKLVTKYAKAAFKEIKDVKGGTKNVKVGGIEQKLTTLEVTFDSKTAAAMSENVLETLKKDKQVKKIIKDMVKVLEDEDLTKLDPDEAYENFIDSVDEALKAVRKQKDQKNQEYFTLVDYVNSKHEIVGRDIIVDGDKKFSYVTVKKGSKYETEAIVYVSDDADQNIILEGNGVDKGGKLTGGYILQAQGKKLLHIDLEKFDVDKFMKGYPKGKINISLSKEFFETISAEASSAIGLANPEIEMDFDCKKNSYKATISIKANSKSVATISVKSKVGGGHKIKVPKDKYVYGDNMENYMTDSVDLNKLVKAMEKAKLPEKLIELVEDAIKDMN